MIECKTRNKVNFLDVQALKQKLQSKLNFDHLQQKHIVIFSILEVTFKKYNSNWEHTEVIYAS